MNQATPLPFAAPGFRFIGHRGACAWEPENTLASFERAAAQGIGWVELDVQSSSDGVPVVMHDATLKRTVGVPGTLAKMTWSSLSQHRIAKTHPIPSLREVLAAMQARGVGVYVEVKSQKSGLVDRIMDDVAATGCTVVLSSFHVDVLQAAQRHPTPVRTMALFTRPPRDALRRVKDVGASEVGIRYTSVTPAWLARFADAGYPVYAYTVNAPLEWDKASHLGLAGVFTDNPPCLHKSSASLGD